MTRTIRIIANEIALDAQIDDSSTADAIWGALPIEGTANRWGEEIYFRIPVLLPEAQDARVDMEVGELAYWPSGNAFCVFFGATPISEGDSPRAYSKVNPFGMTVGDPWVLDAVKDGDDIRVEAVES